MNRRIFEKEKGKRKREKEKEEKWQRKQAG